MIPLRRNFRQFLTPIGKFSLESRVLSTVLLVTAFLGFMDSAYLTFEKLNNSIPPCSLVDGCEKVLTSPYSSVYGVPLSAFGALFYLCVFVLVFVIRESPNPRWFQLLWLLANFGFIFSLMLLYIQIAVIGSYCFYCLLSILTSSIIFSVVTHWYGHLRQPRVS